MTTGRVSLLPQDFAQGGLIDDIDATITAALFCNWDYDGKSDKIGVFLGLKLQDDEGKEHLQYYSAGDPEFFEPGDEGGTFLKAKGARPAMNNNTNCAMFLQSLIAASFPQDRLNTMGIGDALVGLKAHWNQVAQPKRKGLIKTGQASGEERDKVTLLVSAILQLPGQVAAPARPTMGMAKPAISTVAAKPAAVLSPSPAVAVTSPSNGGADDEALTMVLYEILAEAGGSVTKAVLPAAAFKKLMSNPRKSVLVPRIYSQEFLTTAPGITFDGATITMQ